MKMDTWYCAGWSHELTAGPIGRKFLGRRVVLFRDANGTAHALGARCPHRGADLASGSVVDGCIECPFHGWCFDGRGQCVRVPSQPERMKISSLARVPFFPLHERQGAVWIWMGAGEPPAIEPPEDPVGQQGQSVRRLFFSPNLVAAPFLTLLESSLDKAHVPFIHAGTFGSDQDPLVPRQRISVDPDGRGLRAEDDPDCPWHAEPKLPGGVLGLLGRLVLGLSRPVAQHTRFDVRDGAQIYLEYPRGTFDLFLTHVTPADDAHSWLFVESARTRAPHAIGDWIQTRVFRKIFEEGTRESSLLLDAGDDDPQTPVSVESDRLGLAARQLYERWVSSAREDDAPQRLTAASGVARRGGTP